MADGMQDNKLQVTEFISVSELANLMDVSFAEVISKCMGLGIMVSINQRLDAEVIELVASEFGFDVELLYLAFRAGLNLKEVPVHWDHNEGSKVSVLSDSFKMVNEVNLIRQQARRAPVR